MRFTQSRLGTAAALLAGTLTVAVAVSGTALAGQAQAHGGGHAHATALPGWYHTPLNAAQVKAEVAVPKPLDRYTGALHLTRDAYTNGSGALAVGASQALGHALAQGENLQLTDAFVLDGATPSAATRSELAKLAWSNVTSVTCEGYTDYGPHSYNRDQLLGRARATAICKLLRSHNPAIAARVVSFGGTRPVRVGGPLNTHHVDNRRVVVDITGVAGAAVTTPTATTPAVTTPAATTPVVTPPAVTPPVLSAPLAPAIVSTVAGDGTATLTITPPSSDATISGYEYSLDGGSTWLPLTTSGSSTLTATITGLTDGDSYAIEVRADSSAGNGAAATAASVTPSTVPGAPNIISGSADAIWPSDWWTTLSWTAPTSDGGSPITAWDVTQDGTDLGAMSGVTDTSGTYSVTFDTGWNYCSWDDASTPYTVQGVNADGEGVASDTVDVDMEYGC